MGCTSSKEIKNPPDQVSKKDNIVKSDVLIVAEPILNTSVSSKRKSKDRTSNGSPYKGSRLGLILMCRDEFKSKYTQEILHKWRRVQIINVSGKRNEIIRVHYIGWPDTYDFDINLDTDYRRLAPLYLLSVNVELKGFELSEEEAECTYKFFKDGRYDTSKNKSRAPNDGKIIFDTDAYLDVLDIFYRKGSNVQIFKWRRAKILSFTGTKILINYIGWESKYNETLDIEEDSHRLSPFGTKSVEDLSRTVVKEKLAQNAKLENETSNIDSPNSEYVSTEEQLIIKMDEEEIRKEKEFIQILVKNGLHVIEIEGDGNCLFRAVSHQIYGHEEHHEMLRENVVKHLIKHKERFKLFCADDYDQHILKISRLGEWGDDLEIRALEEIMDRNILIYSSGNPDPLSPVNYNEEEAKLLEGVKPILLSYHGFRHYNSICMDNELTPKEVRTSSLLLSVRMKLFGRTMLSPDRPQNYLNTSNFSVNNPPFSPIKYNNNPVQPNHLHSQLPPNFPLPPVKLNSGKNNNNTYGYPSQTQVNQHF